MDRLHAAKALDIESAPCILRGAFINEVFRVLWVSEDSRNGRAGLVIVVVAAVDVIAYGPVAKGVFNGLFLSALVTSGAGVTSLLFDDDENPFDFC